MTSKGVTIHRLRNTALGPRTMVPKATHIWVNFQRLLTLFASACSEVLRLLSPAFVFPKLPAQPLRVVPKWKTARFRLIPEPHLFRVQVLP